ncbi:MAG: hypothetical protein RLZZ126_790, partial [Pseudomonadota bacterium]
MRHSFANSLRAAALAASVTLLAGCGAMMAQNPQGMLKPVNAAPAEASGAAMMLKGADVVAYWTQARYVQGRPEFVSHYEGVVFQFSSADHKALFDKEPRKYIPEYNG